MRAAPVCPPKRVQPRGPSLVEVERDVLSYRIAPHTNSLPDDASVDGCRLGTQTVVLTSMHDTPSRFCSFSALVRGDLERQPIPGSTCRPRTRDQLLHPSPSVPIVGVCRLGTSQRLKGQLISFPNNKKHEDCRVGTTRAWGAPKRQADEFARAFRRDQGRLLRRYHSGPVSRQRYIAVSLQMWSSSPSAVLLHHLLCLVVFFFAALPTVPRTRQRLHGWVSKICPSRKFQT